MTTLSEIREPRVLEIPATVVVPNRAIRVLDQATVWLLFALLIFGPLAFGAVEEWAIVVLRVGAGALMLLWILRQAAAGRIRLSGGLVYLPAAVFVSLVGYQLIAGRTAYIYGTEQALIQLAASASFFFIASNLSASPATIRRLHFALASFASLYALFAILQYVSGTHQLYWVRPLHHGGNPFGAYVNRNHYAGMMELLVAVPMVLFLRLRGSHRAIAGFAAALAAASLVLAQSRGGLIAFGVQLIVVALIVGKERRTILLGLGTIAVVTALVFWLGGVRLMNRLESLVQPWNALTSELRVQVIKDGFRMVKDRPVAGWGLGTFPTTYPQYRSFYTDQVLEHAHNDFLQILVETGVIGFASVVAFLVLVYRRSFQVFHEWLHDDSAALSMAAVIGVTGFLIHSFLDFNLQIPANYALFMAMCGIACRPLADKAQVALRERWKRRLQKAEGTYEPSEA